MSQELAIIPQDYVDQVGFYAPLFSRRNLKVPRRW